MNTAPRRVVQQMAGPSLPVYRAIIDHIVSDGVPPPDDVLARMARTTPNRVAMIRNALAQQDWLTLDDDGAVATIYPFSLTPTGITVTIDGAERHALCAIDSLGVAAMLQRPVLISASCMDCGIPIVISATPQEVEGVAPPGTVVTARYASGAGVQARCHIMRFACSSSHGRRWLDAHGDPDDVLLPVEQAFELASQQFGQCRSHGRRVKPFDRPAPPES